METSYCLNCDTQLNDTFCSHCGQKETHRYTFAHIVHEFVHVFTHADKGMLALARHLLLRPGFVARDLVEGKRKRYFNLFQYLLLIVGFVTFLMVKTDLISDVMKSMNQANSVQTSSRLAAMQQKTAALLQQYNNLFQLVLIPVYAASAWLFFARKRINYAESVVLHVASSAQTSTLAIPITFLMLAARGTSGFMLIAVVSLAVMVFSFALCYRQFFGFGWLRSLLFAVLVFVVSYIIQTVLITLLMLGILFLG